MTTHLRVLAEDVVDDSLDALFLAQVLPSAPPDRRSTQLKIIHGLLELVCAHGVDDLEVHHHPHHQRISVMLLLGLVNQPLAEACLERGEVAACKSVI